MNQKREEERKGWFIMGNAKRQKVLPSAGDWERRKTQIGVQLTGWEQIKRGMEQGIWMPVCEGLAVRFTIIQEQETGTLEWKIPWEWMRDWRVGIGELWAAAIENMPKKRSAVLLPLEQLLEAWISFPLAAGGNQKKQLPFVVYVLTNRERKGGAAALFYPGMLKEASRLLGGEVLILPSSIHEVLLLKRIPGQEQKFTHLVQEINQLYVAPQEVLSNRLYVYRPEQEVLEAITEEEKARNPYQEKTEG